MKPTTGDRPGLPSSERRLGVGPETSVPADHISGLLAMDSYEGFSANDSDASNIASGRKTVRSQLINDASSHNTDSISSLLTAELPSSCHLDMGLSELSLEPSSSQSNNKNEFMQAFETEGECDQDRLLQDLIMTADAPSTSVKSCPCITTSPEEIDMFKKALSYLQMTPFSTPRAVWSTQFDGIFSLTHGGDFLWWIGNYMFTNPIYINHRASNLVARMFVLLNYYVYPEGPDCVSLLAPQQFSMRDVIDESCKYCDEVASSTKDASLELAEGMLEAIEKAASFLEDEKNLPPVCGSCFPIPPEGRFDGRLN